MNATGKTTAGICWAALLCVLPHLMGCVPPGAFSACARDDADAVADATVSISGPEVVCVGQPAEFAVVSAARDDCSVVFFWFLNTSIEHTSLSEIFGTSVTVTADEPGRLMVNVDALHGGVFGDVLATATRTVTVSEASDCAASYDADDPDASTPDDPADDDGGADVIDDSSPAVVRPPRPE